MRGLVGLSVKIWVAFAAVGCVGPRTSQTLPISIPVSTPSPVAPTYRVGCPDVLLVTFTDRPDWDTLASVDLDGTLPLPESLGRPRVQGLTLDEVKHAVAESGQQKPETVSVSLESARSARVTVCGPVNGRCRSLPYRGAEPVLEFLVRNGAIERASANLNRVYVVRPNVAAGDKADVFHVDVDAVVLDGLAESNVPLLPGDQIYVGESRRSSFGRLLPSWLRPAYRQFMGLLPQDPVWWGKGESGP
jgi:protein involved in polysaccharide export with SLBB domain